MAKKQAKKRSDYPTYNESLSDQMSKKQRKKSPGATAPNQIISVKANDYRRLRSMVDSQMRRKLAGEFPFNSIGREVEVSTNTFWLEVLSTHAEAYWAHHDYQPDLLQAFISGVGTHPTAWGAYDTVEELEADIDAFIQKHRGG